MRVSTHITNLDLPAGSAYRDTGPDPDTYRLEARGIATGETVTFEVQTTEAGGGPSSTYTYGAVEGTDGTDVVYRSDQYFRLVSNGIPTVGEDTSADYDDEYMDAGAVEDPTLLVKLGADVRGAVSDPSGEIASVTLPVGVPGMPPNLPTDDTILTGTLVYNKVRDNINTPALRASLATARASEDWAQARIQFETSGTVPKLRPVENLLLVDGTATSAGLIKIRGKARINGSVIRFASITNVTSGDTEKMIADNIAADIIALGMDWSASAHKHSIQFPPAVHLVLVDAIATAGPDRVDFTRILNTVADVDVRRLDLEFNPLDFTETVGGDIHEEHALAINYADDDLTTIDVFALPFETLGMGVRGTGFGYLWRTFVEGIENTIFIDERAVDTDDAEMPFSFGHEIGHVLTNGDFPAADSTGHSADSWNLMKSGTDAVDTWGASKRLNADQIMDVRLDSGPGIPNNPEILSDN